MIRSLMTAIRRRYGVRQAGTMTMQNVVLIGLLATGIPVVTSLGDSTTDSLQHTYIALECGAAAFEGGGSDGTGGFGYGAGSGFWSHGARSSSGSAPEADIPYDEYDLCDSLYPSDTGDDELTPLNF